MGRQIIEMSSQNKAAQHTLRATLAQSRFNIGPIGISCLVEKSTDESLRIVLNLFQVILAAEAFRINLIDILHAASVCAYVTEGHGDRDLLHIVQAEAVPVETFSVSVRLGPPQAGHYRPRSTDTFSKSAQL